MLLMMLVLAACANSGHRDTDAGPRASEATVTTLMEKPASWPQRWEPELEGYYFASIRLIDAVHRREPFEIIQRRIAAVQSASQDLLRAVDGAGPPPANMQAAADTMRSVLEKAPRFLDHLLDNCTLDVAIREPQACNASLNAWAENGSPLVSAANNIESFSSTSAR